MMKKIYTLAAMLLGLMGLLSACISAEDTEIALSDQDPDNLVYNCDRQTVVLRIDCNRSWKASASEDWIEIKEASGKAGSSQKLAMTLSSNTTTAYRSAEVTIAAGKKTLVLTLTQAPEIIYFVNEKFDVYNLIEEAELPERWLTIDNDGDGFVWRCLKVDDDHTYAYSASYLDYLGRSYSPDNYMVTPRFTLPSKGYFLRWESLAYDTEYPGDKYQVFTARYIDGELELLIKVYEGQTSASEEPEKHVVSLDDYDDIGSLCIAFRHYDSKGLGRVLITNVEVSNRK